MNVKFPIELPPQESFRSCQTPGVELRVSDKVLTKDTCSGFLDKLDPIDKLMADRKRLPRHMLALRMRSCSSNHIKFCPKRLSDLYNNHN